MLKIAAIVIAVIIAVMVIFDIGLITSRFIKPNLPFMNNFQEGPQTGQATVSGTIHLNGPIPEGASVSIGVRDYGSNGSYNVFAYGMSPVDDMPWHYNQAKDGASYEFQATLDINNQVAFASDSLTVSAPATEEVLTINIESTPTASPAPAIVSGHVYINGYIPQNATFDVMARPYGSTGDFSDAVDNLPAEVKQSVNYANAVAGQKYELKGQLFDKNGTVIGSSASVVISAPSDNLVMTINSAAQPPAGSVTPIQTNAPPTAGTSATPSPSGTGTAISGTINFNGSAPGGSSVVILAKQPADTSYQTVVNGITPSNGSTWTWNGATAGVTYNMVAVLKGQVNGDQNIDYADSQTYTVAAPAVNQLFTLNTGISMGAPTGSVWITCGTKSSNNVWSGNTVNFSSTSGAQYYTFQVGSTSGGNDIANVSQAAQSTTNQTIPLGNINDSVIYYAQYAVSSVTNPTPAQMSPFSTAYTLKCPN